MAYEITFSLGVLIAAIASIVLGMIWYSPAVFGNMWAKLSGVNGQKKKSAATSYIVAFIGSIIMALAINMLLNALGVTGIGGAFTFVFIVWIGFILTTSLGGVLWGGKKFGAYVLNNLYSLVNLLVMSAILVSL